MASRKRRKKKASGRGRSRRRLIHLDAFSLRSILAGAALADTASKAWVELDACWRRQVADHWDEIKSALVAASTPFRFERWQRIVQYRYSNAPLLCAGSVITVAGGRFNFGSFDPISFPPFPALYLAEDRDTAWLERYGALSTTGTKLTAEELLLTRRESVTYVSVSGSLDRVVDLREPERLDDLVSVIARFEIPADLVKRSRAVFKAAPQFPNTRELLLTRTLEEGWRMIPTLVSAPANSQSFGQITLTAGIAGIVFPSTKTADGRCCLAAFPVNFGNGESWIAVDDPAPPNITHTRLDQTTYLDFLAYARV